MDQETDRPTTAKTGCDHGESPDRATGGWVPNPMRLFRTVRAARYRAVNWLGAIAIARLWRDIPPARITLVSRLFDVTINFALNATALWAAVVLVAPGLLGSTAAGMQSLAQTIPATIVALFVFTLGALVGIAQLSINAYGHRAALMLVEDHAVAVSVIRPLVLAVAALLLAGQIPERGDPTELVTAGFATLALLTVAAIVQSVGLLGATLLRYTAPLTFSDLVVEDVRDHLELGVAGLVRWKVPMLEEMAKLALRRGDSAAVGAALQGMTGIAYAYVETVPASPKARGMPFEDFDPPFTAFGWLGEDLRESLARIGEDTLRQAAPSEDSDHTVDALGEVARVFVQEGFYPEAKRTVNGLIALGCTSHQVGSGYVNHMARPAGTLAELVRLSADRDTPHLAGYILAGWTLVIAYADEHFGGPDQPLGRHPNWGPGLSLLPSDPPWEGAANVIQSADWRRMWANQMNLGHEFVLLLLRLAHDSHATLQAGEALPALPSLNEVMSSASSE